MKKPLAFKDIIHQIYGKHEIYGQGMCTENLSLLSNQCIWPQDFMSIDAGFIMSTYEVTLYLYT